MKIYWHCDSYFEEILLNVWTTKWNLIHSCPCQIKLFLSCFHAIPSLLNWVSGNTLHKNQQILCYCQLYPHHLLLSIVFIIAFCLSPFCKIRILSHDLKFINHVCVQWNLTLDFHLILCEYFFSWYVSK